MTVDANKGLDEEYILDQQVGYLLRMASQRHATIFQGHSLMDLTPTQFSVILRINEYGPCSQNHLGRLVSLDVATIKGVVDRLHQKKLVKLEPSMEDKRKIIISLTTAADQIMENLHTAGKSISEETLRPLSRNEHTKLLQLLRKIT